MDIVRKLTSLLTYLVPSATTKEIRDEKAFLFGVAVTVGKRTVELHLERRGIKVVTPETAKAKFKKSSVTVEKLDGKKQRVPCQKILNMPAFFGPNEVVAALNLVLKEIGSKVSFDAEKATFDQVLYEGHLKSLCAHRSLGFHSVVMLDERGVVLNVWGGTKIQERWQDFLDEARKFSPNLGGFYALVEEGVGPVLASMLPRIWDLTREMEERLTEEDTDAFGCILTEMATMKTPLLVVSNAVGPVLVLPKEKIPRSATALMDLIRYHCIDGCNWGVFDLETGQSSFTTGFNGAERMAIEEGRMRGDSSCYKRRLGQDNDYEKVFASFLPSERSSASLFLSGQRRLLLQSPESFEEVCKREMPSGGHWVVYRADDSVAGSGWIPSKPSPNPVKPSVEEPCKCEVSPAKAAKAAKARKEANTSKATKAAKEATQAAGKASPKQAKVALSRPKAKPISGKAAKKRRAAP